MILGFHIILTGYGHWLPNDPRGSMSHEIFAPELQKLGAIHFGRKRVQPSREELRAFYQEAQKHLHFPLLWWDDRARNTLGQAFGEAARSMGLICYACAILSNHVHLHIRKHIIKCERMSEELREAGRNLLIQRGFAPPAHPVFSADACHIFKSTIAEMWSCAEYVASNYPKHKLPPVPCAWVRQYDGWPYREQLRSPKVDKNKAQDAGETVIAAKAPNANNEKAPNVNKKNINSLRNNPESEPTPKGLRLHIGIFGRRNVGKSSLLNAMTRQAVSIVSDQPGTTTDPVEKPMELQPIGPALFIDTAGIDDLGALGELRVARTRQVLDRTDVGIVVAEAGRWGPFEQALLDELGGRNVPAIVVVNKCDLAEPGTLDAGKTPVVRTVACIGQGVADLREALVRVAPEDFINAPAILADLVPPGELAVLVVPIDKEAPKGRLILPQVQSIRDLLDGDAFCLVVKERELREALARLNRPPALVVTDSQAFLKVSADTPPGVPMTSFSILFARNKGDLGELVRGAMAIDTLGPGSRILVAEACSHHPIGEDIGRVKIPRWLTQYVGGKLEFTTVQGHEFPADLAGYDLVVHCGACMWNRREMLSRILRCRQAGVPITNYGLTIAYSLGIFERALGPFPHALEIYRQAKRSL